MKRLAAAVVWLLAVAFTVVSVSPVGATVPGEDGKIAFVSDVSGRYQIYLVNPDGSNIQKVTSFVVEDDLVLIGSISWSPDGRSLAFTRSVDGRDWSIWTIDADGTHLSYITTALTSSVSWSPDRKSLAFVVSAVGAVNGLDTSVIAVLDLATQQVAIVTDPGDWVSSLDPNRTTSDYSPVWTPDGREIIFARHIPGSASISNAVLRAVNVATLTTRGDARHGPPPIFAIDVTPSGQHVVTVAAERSFVREASTVSVEDIGLTGVGLPIAVPEGSRIVSNQVSVAPSGSRFAISLSSGSLAVWTMALDGSDAFQVVDGHTPAWQPVNPYPMGLVDPVSGRWHLRDATGMVESFYYGNPGDYPFMGDWDCDGVDTPGLYRQSAGYVYLRDSNTQGIADYTFFFGNPGDIPLAGDFNGDGCDTVSIYRPSQSKVFIINSLGSGDSGLGAADIDYYFGNPGDTPFTGDFDGDGIDTIGLYRQTTGLVYFRNTHTQGNADDEFLFGNPHDRFVAGDWNHDGTDTPAVYRPGNTTHYFRFTNSQGNAEAQYIWGQPDWLPATGTYTHN